MMSHFELLTRKVLHEIFFRVTNSTSIELNFELLTQRLNFIVYFRVTNSKLKNEKFNFELLTRNLKRKSFTSSRSRKIKSYTSSYLFEG